MKSESKEATKKLRRKGNQIILLTSIAVITVYIGVLLISIFKKGELEPNVIGDTLGGTLSPLIGLVSAILIYITIGQQIEANRLIQEQFSIERKEKFEEVLFLEIIKELNELVVRLKEFPIKDPMGNIINEIQGFKYNYAFFQYNLFANSNGLRFGSPETRIREDCALDYFLLFEKYCEILELTSSKVMVQKAYVYIVRSRSLKINSSYFSILKQNLFNTYLDSDSKRWLLHKLLNFRVFLKIATIGRYFKVAEGFSKKLEIDEEMQEDNQKFLNFFKSENFLKVETLLKQSRIIEMANSASNNRIMGLVNIEEERKGAKEAKVIVISLLREFKDSELFSFENMEGYFQWWGIDFERI